MSRPQMFFTCLVLCAAFGQIINQPTKSNISLMNGHHLSGVD